jgi:hypothetical protein
VRAFLSLGQGVPLPRSGIARETNLLSCASCLSSRTNSRALGHFVSNRYHTPTKAEEELERERVERAKAESTARTLQAELTELRDEKRKTLETVTAWVERATRAEARLEEFAKGAGERRS